MGRTSMVSTLWLIGAGIGLYPLSIGFVGFRALAASLGGNGAQFSKFARSLRGPPSTGGPLDIRREAADISQVRSPVVARSPVHLSASTCSVSGMWVQSEVCVFSVLWMLDGLIASIAFNGDACCKRLQ